MELSSISSTIAADRGIVWQYLTLYIEFCAPNDRHAAIVDEMEPSSISSTIAADRSIGLTIPDAVYRVLYS